MNVSYLWHLTPMFKWLFNYYLGEKIFGISDVSTGSTITFVQLAAKIYIYIYINRIIYMQSSILVNLSFINVICDDQMIQFEVNQS